MKSTVDWERIEALYRVGQLSIREIAKKAGITDRAIRKRATAHGWTRDLSPRVQAEVRTALVRGPVRTPGTADSRTEREVVAEAVATTVQVVRGHQGRIGRMWAIHDRLEATLLNAVDNKAELYETVKAAIEAGALTEGAWKALMEATTLAGSVTVFRDLATALKTVIALDRQAFGIIDGQDEGRDTYEERLKRLAGE